MLRDTIPGRSSQQFKQDPITGVLLFYDQSRLMYISTDRESYQYGIDHKTINKSMWMKVSGNVNTLTNGIIISRNGVITCLSVSTQNIAANCIFRIKSSISGIDIATITLSGSSFEIDDSLSININKNDYLRVYADVISGQIDYPILNLEIAWR